MPMFIGCDPGFKGALALLGEDGTLISVVDMPIQHVKGKNQLVFDSHGRPVERARQTTVLDPHAIFSLMSGWYEMANSEIFYIGEKVWARPDEGRSSVSKLMEGFGLVQGMAYGLQMKVVLVAPQTWKAAMGVTADKNTSLAKAREVFPDMQPYFRRKMDDGRAEAALIGLWGYQKYIRKELLSAQSDFTESTD